MASRGQQPNKLTAVAATEKEEAVELMPELRKPVFVKGSIRLAVDKWGHIEVTEPAKFAFKEDNNLFLVEYELVNVVEES
ncbi:hypothetical protein ACH5RR_018035 [Cinchona calisaya]|uniref:Uncharacterized protein n=1 Tax=Cinchona calisaya TaxID=153742 RepID=A0ABD2ZKF2_9GENT